MRSGRRGLSNLKTTVEALPALVSEKSVKLFTTHRVFTESEIHSRYEILLENYCKTIHIEALTMADMTKKYVIPACIGYQDELARVLSAKKACGGFDCSLEESLLGRISQLSACLFGKLNALESATIEAKSISEALMLGKFYRDRVFGAMSELRLVIDELETIVAKKYWTLPTYAEILYSVM